MLAEYALAGIDKPIGVSSYDLTRALPRNLQSALPTVEQIEAELSTPETATKSAAKKTARTSAVREKAAKKTVTKPKGRKRKNG